MLLVRISFPIFRCHLIKNCNKIPKGCYNHVSQVMRKSFPKPYVNNKGADQPAHPRSLISTFVVRCLDSMICIFAISKVSRF